MISPRVASGFPYAMFCQTGARNRIVSCRTKLICCRSDLRVKRRISSPSILTEPDSGPLSGSVKIDGEDIRRFTLKSLRQQISFVLQETILFRAPVWQNIAYGKPEATRGEIIRAAKLANAHEFIERMPSGYDTVIGERGETLSGGQRQRIAIARAIIHDTPI